MFRPLTGLFAATAMILAAGSTMAQDAKEPVVIATINGSPITDRDVAYTNEFLGPRLGQVPEQFRGRVIVDILVDRKLFADLARTTDLMSRPAFKERLAYLTEEALRDIYIEDLLSAEINQDAVRARYTTEIAKLPKVEEMRARHILVKTEEDAKAIAAEAQGGADFAELAKAKSEGPTKANGGDLGYFTADKMVPEFSTAAAALEIGAVSGPVKSQFGWHIIKLEDKRNKPAPTFEQVKAGVERMVLADMVKEKSAALREAADIKFTEGYEPPPLPGQAPAKAN